jgi:hypothetical protein
LNSTIILTSVATWHPVSFEEEKFINGLSVNCELIQLCSTVLSSGWYCHFSTTKSTLAFLGFFLGLVFDPGAEAKRLFETSLNVYHVTRCHIPEDNATAVSATNHTICVLVRENMTFCVQVHGFGYSDFLVIF